MSPTEGAVATDPAGSAAADDRWAIDTSLAIAALDASHAAHETARGVVIDRRPRLAGHAALETFSVLTRMPGSLAVSPTAAHDLITAVFPEPLWLTNRDMGQLFELLRALGITGGSVYDALVGWTAVMNGHQLLSRDLRARRTYELIGVDVEYFL